jgi:hypothetical protein
MLRIDRVTAEIDVRPAQGSGGPAPTVTMAELLADNEARERVREVVREELRDQLRELERLGLA